MYVQRVSPTDNLQKDDFKSQKSKSTLHPASSSLFTHGQTLPWAAMCVPVQG